MAAVGRLRETYQPWAVVGHQTSLRLNEAEIEPKKSCLKFVKRIASELNVNRENYCAKQYYIPMRSSCDTYENGQDVGIPEPQHAVLTVLAVVLTCTTQIVVWTLQTFEA